MTAYQYFEWEDRWYRAPPDDVVPMDIWNPTRRVWEPYVGDPARVVFEATNWPQKPAELPESA